MTNNITFNNDGSFTLPAYLTAYLTKYEAANARGKALTKAAKTRLVNSWFGKNACISSDKLKTIHTFVAILNPAYDKNEVSNILAAFVLDDEFYATYDALTASGVIEVRQFKYLD